MLGRKRKAYDTALIFKQDSTETDLSSLDSRKRNRDFLDTSYTPARGDYDNYNYRSKRRNDFSFRGPSSDRRYY